jgi:hypothetical protein
MADVKFISNELEDFEGGGLYPGGSGVIQELKYVLWDYDGKQPPNSVVAVHMKFVPSDGSNEGKPVGHYWSVGPASDFAPDPEGGRLVGLKARDRQSESSNWAFALKKFHQNCGLEKGKLSTDKGLRVLDGTVATFVREDQPDRQGLADQKPAGEQKKFKPTTLVPTKAKFPWEKGAGRTTTKASTTTTTTAAAAVAASTNGTGETDISVVIKELLTNAGGSMEYAELPKALLGALGTVERSVRNAMVTKSKDAEFINSLATENGWTFDGKELVL